MLKKLWSYQELLSASSHSERYIYHYKLRSIIFFILFIIALGELFNGREIIFIPIILTLPGVYAIVNSQKKMFEIVPVSKLYSHINIYLYAFVTSFFMSVVITIGIRSIKILELFALNTIIISILLPIFFIRINALRKILAISVVTLLIIVLRSLTTSLPVITNHDNVQFFKSIGMMPNYSEFLLLLVGISVVMIPISIFTSYRIYNGKW